MAIISEKSVALRFEISVHQNWNDLEAVQILTYQ